MLRKGMFWIAQTGNILYYVDRSSLHFSPRGEAKWVRGLSGRGASRLARAGVLERYVEHGKQAQRSPGGRIACFDRRVVRNAGLVRRKPHFTNRVVALVRFVDQAASSSGLPAP